jgi:hypothetical protein
MGLFDFPRIHVRGTYLANVGTGNNDSASPGEELSVVSDSERVQPVLQGRSDEEFTRWMTSLDQVGLLRAQWNYYGDMAFRFIDVRVGGVQLDASRILTQPSEDALVGARVYLNHALMCDANPEGFDSTQVICESLQINSAHAFKDGSFVSRKPTRGVTRSLNWFRNVSFHGPFGLPPHGLGGELSSGGAGGASASFEHLIEVRPEDLEPATDASEAAFHRLIGSSASPGASALVAALRERGYGLLFRYNLYLCSPLLSDTELARRFAAGEKVPNPAYGRMVGTIAPVFRGEESYPVMGRFLKSCNGYENPHRPERPYRLAPVVAHLDEGGRRLSLDLANTLPEDGPDGEKFDLGVITVGIRKATNAGEDPAGNAAEILSLGTVANDRNAYLTRAGMADLDLRPLSDEHFELLLDDSYELVLCSARAGVLLSETEYMLVADSLCNYLDELPPGETWDDAPVRQRLAQERSKALRGETPVFARRRGRIPLEHIEVVVEQWRLTPTGSPNEYGVYKWRLTPTGSPNVYGVYKYPTLLGKESLVLENGRGVFRLRPTAGPGLRRYRFVPASLWPQEIAPRTLAALAFHEFFVEVRVLPYDDYSAITDDQLNFTVIYREIFRYYHLVLPAMSVRLDMSDPTIWGTPTAAQYILRMIDPSLWDHYEYMPRTRDLSRYRRDLLARFCRDVLTAHDVPLDSGEPPVGYHPRRAGAGRPSLIDLLSPRAREERS